MIARALDGVDARCADKDPVLSAEARRHGLDPSDLAANVLVGLDQHLFPDDCIAFEEAVLCFDEADSLISGEMLPDPEKVLAEYLRLSDPSRNPPTPLRPLPIREMGGKIRVATLHHALEVQVARRLTQVLLRRIKGLLTIKDVLAGGEITVNTKVPGVKLYSADLSAATDYIPHEVAETVADVLAQKLSLPHDYHVSLKRVWGPHTDLSTGQITRRGVHMGLGPSWVLLNLLNAFAAWEAGRRPNDHRICGDDLVGLWTRSAATQYETTIQDLGLVVNKSKSFFGGRGVFCEKLLSVVNGKVSTKSSCRPENPDPRRSVDAYLRLRPKGVCRGTRGYIRTRPERDNMYSLYHERNLSSAKHATAVDVGHLSHLTGAKLAAGISKNFLAVCDDLAQVENEPLAADTVSRLLPQKFKAPGKVRHGGNGRGVIPLGGIVALAEGKLAFASRPSYRPHKELLDDLFVLKPLTNKPKDGWISVQDMLIEDMTAHRIKDALNGCVKQPRQPTRADFRKLQRKSHPSSISDEQAIVRLLELIPKTELRSRDKYRAMNLVRKLRVAEVKARNIGRLPTPAGTPNPVNFSLKSRELRKKLVKAIDRPKAERYLPKDRAEALARKFFQVPQWIMRSGRLSGPKPLVTLD
jgi:hypothetical protein